MIRFPIVEKNTKKIRPNLTTKYILSESVGLDGAELIPIDLGGRLITPQVSIYELGKQLLKAAAEGDVPELKSLLTRGAPFTADWLGTSPLHYAAQNNHLEVCEILLRAGTSKDARTKVDRTPLHMAAYEGHFDIVDLLLKHGSDVNCKDLLGMAPLHWAVQNGHLQVVRLLVQNGADLVHLNKFKLSPVDIAIQTGRNDIIEALNNDPSLENGVFCNFVEQETDEGENASSPPLPVEAVLLEDYDASQQASETPMNFVDEENDEESNDLDGLPQSDLNENSFSDSALKILQEHGITMLPNEENNILTTVMESGHSVVLTDVGKEVLDSVKQAEQKKIITISADDYLAMTANSPKSNLLKQVKVIPTKTVKRIVLNKSGNKVVANASKESVKDKLKMPNTDMELVMTQLIEARQQIEMYKAKLLKKEQEAERYKQQLRLLMESN